MYDGTVGTGGMRSAVPKIMASASVAILKSGVVSVLAAELDE